MTRFNLKHFPADSPGAGKEARTLKKLAAELERSWCDDIYALVASGDVDAAMDVLFSRVDDLFQSGNFELCDTVLSGVDVNRLDSNLLVGLLSSSLRAADNLPRRTDLVTRVERRLRELAPERVERLLAHLR